ncbi:LOW QUALITY PROTEIN: hypothetical protein MAR_027823 [Mya arenaria]|uniref:Transposase n=1 Tax=Mya arenaria TaxID=6604 RepID=A0ABY7EYR5_MYAAR|nr:LOW QUALITY PROTEIN: hypothetical protein MAR_027823 [Mya arenaria]
MKEKNVRVRASWTFVRKCGRDPSFLSRIITTDGTWFHYFELESKQASIVWEQAKRQRIKPYRQEHPKRHQGGSSIKPPYSPDFEPFDFAYFAKLKTYLRGTRFNDITKISHAI